MIPTTQDYCRFAASDPARLVVVVDTEEEYDWSLGKSRAHTSVRALRSLHKFQSLCDEYTVTPVYVIDYPVASQPDGHRPLQEIASTGRCLIGAHLHPWVNPPFIEEVLPRNTFPGNLPRALEATKLQILGECIAERFGALPTIYKAGRYGIGKNTADILEQQGYEVDLSVCPYMSYTNEGGPDFTASSAWPYWFGTRRRLLELPLTIGFSGVLRKWGVGLRRLASSPMLTPFHAVGVLARLQLIDRVWLSPEGYSTVEHQRLVRTLLKDGLRIFSFAFHSPSLEAGHTPYVRSTTELDQFLSRCRKFFDFFLGELGGQPSTPLELTQLLATHTLARSVEDL